MKPTKTGRLLLAACLGTAVVICPLPAAADRIHYQIQPGDSLAALAAAVNSNTALVAAMNNLPNTTALPGNGTLYLPQQEEGVVLGDWGNLAQIAQTFGVSVTELSNYNDIGDCTTLPDDLIIELPPRVSGQVRAALALASRQGNRQAESQTTEKIPWQSPVKGIITSPYGERHGSFHHGIDIANDEGTPIHAAQKGRVVFAGWKNEIYGNMVTVDHGDDLITNYAHCSKIVVEAGDRVNAGDVLAKMGQTGRATGPHCHFEVKLAGEIQNPNYYVEFEPSE